MVQSDASGTAERPVNDSGRDAQGPEHRALPDVLPPSHWQQLELDDDDDSALGSDLESTRSLTSTIFEYRMLHGRRFHGERGKADAYSPNDQKHQDALDVYHHMHTLLYEDKLYAAPLEAEKLKKVLDIGTGTGQWAIDFGDTFPECEVIGTDVSPMQKEWLPTNVRIEIDDAEMEWTWPDDTFDYIHIRNLVGSIKDWDHLYEQAYRVLKPGGYIEHHDTSARWRCDNGFIPDHSPLDQWHRVFWAGGEISGRTFKIIEDDVQRRGMAKAGFDGLVTREWKVPNTPWPTDKRMAQVGAFHQMTFETDAEGFVLYVWNALLGWSKDEVSTWLAHCKQQFKNPQCHPYMVMRMVYGRKPEKQ